MFELNGVLNGGCPVNCRVGFRIWLLRPALSKAKNQCDNLCDNSGDSLPVEFGQLIMIRVLTASQTIRELVSFFGKLESFDIYKGPETTDKGESRRYIHIAFLLCISPAISELSASELPVPHDAPRKPGMDMRCFEIKWCHRDDCVAALNVSSYRSYLCIQTH
jgi:hypothetical protein